MKYIILALFSCFICLGLTSFAQGESSKEAVEKFKRFFNAKQTDSIYNQWSDKAKAIIAKDALDSLLQKQLYPLDTITSSMFLKEENGLDHYRLNFNDDSLKLILGTDSNNFIETLLFKPYEKPQESISAQTVDNTDNHSAADTADLTRTTSSTTITERSIDDLVDSLALKYITLPNTSGLAIGIINKGKTGYYYYGETTHGNKQLPDHETLFEIGSISKTFTATLLATAVLKESVKLDDLIINFLPDSVAANQTLKDITFRNLATHTSGLPRMPNNFVPVEELDPYKDYSRNDLFYFLKNYQLKNKADSVYAYSNLGYGIIGELLAYRKKTSYNEMVRDMICKPLDLPNITEFPDSEMQKNFIPTYNKDGQLTPHWHFLAFSGAGSLKSTTPDLLKYAEANINPPNNDIGKAILLTQKPFWLASETLDLGLAWHITIDNFQEIFWHNGSTFGSSSFIAFSPEKKVAVIVLANAAQSVDDIGLLIIKKLMEIIP